MPYAIGQPLRAGAPITALDFDLYRRHFETHTRLIIGMGSIEARGICSAIVDQTFRFPTEGSPVGYPEPGKKIILLNEAGQEVGANEIGEIGVSGSNVNTGYWRQPESTAAKFVPAPDGSDERVYLTGDLGRMMPDGFLVHLGRKDFMVKIRGFRVDFSEIERALLSHPMIQDAGVRAWDREPGEKYLAAYVVARQQGLVTVKELFQFLRDRLPDYMIPSVIKRLDSLPLINGKLDRSLLPKPDHHRPDLGSPYVQPRNEFEEQLSQLWAELLALDRVGIHDNFFDLGGHSLSAVRFASETEKRLGQPISVSTLLKSPTIAQLTGELPKQMKVPPSPLIAIQADGSRPPFFCVHGTDSYGRFARYLGSDQPFFGLAQHLEGRKVRHTRIEDIAAYYLREVRKIQAAGPYYLGGHSIGGLIAFEMAQQLQYQGQEIAFLVLLDSGAPRSQRSMPSDPSKAGDSKHRLKDKLKVLRWSAKEKLLKNAKTGACAVYHRTGMSLPPAS